MPTINRFNYQPEATFCLNQLISLQSSNCHIPSGANIQLHTPRKTNMTHEQISHLKMYLPIEHGDFPACHVRFSGVSFISGWGSKQPWLISAE